MALLGAAASRLDLDDQDFVDSVQSALRPVEHRQSSIAEALRAGRELNALLLRAAAWAKGYRNPDRLTPREIEVLGLIAAGHTNAEIAGRLSASVRTVERHISNLYGKIGARGKADATTYALREGIVPPA
jgi:DNA-binding NarL/FixJ family response regulator